MQEAVGSPLVFFRGIGGSLSSDSAHVKVLRAISRVTCVCGEVWRHPQSEQGLHTFGTFRPPELRCGSPILAASTTKVVWEGGQSAGFVVRVAMHLRRSSWVWLRRTFSLVLVVMLCHAAQIMAADDSAIDLLDGSCSAVKQAPATLQKYQVCVAPPPQMLE